MANDGNTPFSGVTVAFASFIAGLQGMAQDIQSINRRLANIEHHIQMEYNPSSNISSNQFLTQSSTQFPPSSSPLITNEDGTTEKHNVQKANDSTPSSTSIFTHKDRIITSAPKPRATNLPKIPKAVDPKSIIMPDCM